MDPFAHRIHQHRARPVEQVAGGNHLPAWSQEVPFGRWRSGCGTPEDAEDGSEWGVCVCVGRSVERIETQQVLGLGCDAQRLGTLHLLGCDARDELGPGKGLAHDLVGVDVEFLLRIAGGPDPRRSGVASECGPAHLVGENATGEGVCWRRIENSPVVEGCRCSSSMMCRLSVMPKGTDQLPVGLPTLVVSAAGPHRAAWPRRSVVISRAMLIAIAGSIGAGKTTVAKAVDGRLGIPSHAIDDDKQRVGARTPEFGAWICIGNAVPRRLQTQGVCAHSGAPRGPRCRS